MATLAMRFWKLLNTEINPEDVVKSGVDSSKAIFELAKTLNNPTVKPEIQRYIGQFDSLLDVLNSPFAQVFNSSLPFLPLATGLIKFCIEKTKQEPTLAQCVAIVSQVAYLESFRAILALPENQPWLEHIGQIPASKEVEKQIKKLRDSKLEDQEAKRVIVCFHESELASGFNQVLSARLQQAGLEVGEAETLTERVAWNTHRYLSQAWAESPDAIKHLVSPSFQDWLKEQKKYQSIDDYLKQQIAKAPLAKVFSEDFTFQDIYVSLKARLLDKNGEPDRYAKTEYLETWAKAMLKEHNQLDQVMFVQGDPGRGKSVFCRMFADCIGKYLHPIWTPILIQLKNIVSFKASFEETLRTAVGADFVINDDGWLVDKNTRFLFILDGFDELQMEGRSSGELERFFKQVGRFQEDCNRHLDKGHRVLITGRPLALQGIEPFMPDNLKRVEILEMDNQLQDEWLKKWKAQLIKLNPESGEKKALDFQTFLRDSRCPDRVRELSREPLLLYLLAAMHRDGKLTVEMFEGTSGVGAKILIYDQSLQWVLTELRSTLDIRNLTGQETSGLRHILAAAGLCVVQSGGESASVAMIEERLREDDIARCLLELARQRIEKEKSPLRNVLTAFYLQPSKQEGSVEFTHKSFGEFLCAEQLKKSLKIWSQCKTIADTNYQECCIPEPELYRQIYDLLGYGGLTQEIVEYLMALIDSSQIFDAEQLFKRLEKFYLRWCKGEFIDEPLQNNLPQVKMLKLRGQNISLGVRQVDIYTGLNVMILLMELHRYAHSKDNLQENIAFYACGKKAIEGFDESRLLRIIGYSHCIDVGSFVKTVGQFLSSARLNDINLSGADLHSADLQEAHLSRANLSGAYLKGAKLSKARLKDADCRRINLDSAILKDASLIDTNLRGAELSRANLSHATLCGTDLGDAILTDADLSYAYLGAANLSDANLRATNLRNAILCSADLSGADLSGADLRGADLRGADLEDISCDWTTKWEGAKALNRARNVPIKLKKN